MLSVLRSNETALAFAAALEMMRCAIRRPRRGGQSARLGPVSPAKIHHPCAVSIPSLHSSTGCGAGNTGSARARIPSPTRHRAPMANGHSYRIGRSADGSSVTPQLATERVRAQRGERLWQCVHANGTARRLRHPLGEHTISQVTAVSARDRDAGCMSTTSSMRTSSSSENSPTPVLASMRLVSSSVVSSN